MANTVGGLPVTAGVEQSRVSGAVSVRPEEIDILDKETQVPTAAGLDRAVSDSNDRRRIQNSRQTDINSEFIRVSSSIGRSDIRGNLSLTRPSELYEKIARLI